MEGEIAISSSVETPSRFKGEIEGRQLVAPQPTGDDGTDCSPITEVQPDERLCGVWRVTEADAHLTLFQTLEDEHLVLIR